MLDKGRILKIGLRQDFETLRDSKPEQLQNQQDELIRQFLRGDAQGPITQRIMTSDYEDDLLMVSTKQEK